MMEPIHLPHVPAIPRKHVLARFLADLVRLPHWHKGVLMIAILAAAIGLGGRYLRPQTISPQSGAPQVAPMGGSRSPGFVSSNSHAPNAPAEPAPAQPSDGSNPWLSRIGISVLLGYLIGWAFRAFVKVMTMLSVVLAALLAMLSYMNVLNVDMTTAAKQHYESAATRVTDEASRLKDAAMGHIPSAGGGLIGAWMGVRKRKL